MNLKETVIITAVIAVAVALGVGGVLGAEVLLVPQQSPSLGSATSQCDVTETTVAIGNQVATTILAAGSYQWAAFVQPVNATNTTSLSIGGTAVSGKGYQLTPATSTSPIPSAVFGFAPNMPYRGAISARTNTGSTSINVISCH